MVTAMIWETSSTSPAETERLGQLIGQHLSGGEVIELKSDLGGGKTTLVKGLVRGCGSRARVTSPTFTISRVYQAPKLRIYHFDFYRLSDPGILTEQLAEAVSDSQAVTLVEWGDIVEDVLPAEKITIELRPVAADPVERIIKVGYTESNSQMIKDVETEWQVSQP